MGMATAEADRRIANIVNIGRVVSIDTGSSRVRVKIGDIETTDIKVARMQSGKIKVHWMPSLDEQVIVYAPSGDLSRAFVQGSLPQDGHGVAPDEDTPTIDLGGATLSIVGDIEVDGKITVTGDVVASGISLVTHTHGGVVPGGGSTGVPNG